MKNFSIFAPEFFDVMAVVLYWFFFFLVCKIINKFPKK